MPGATDALIGARIHSLRVTRHVSADDLAERCSITPDRLVRIEGGEEHVEADLLERIARALSVDVAAFFAGPEDVPGDAGIDEDDLDRLELARGHLEAALKLLRAADNDAAAYVVDALDKIRKPRGNGAPPPQNS